MDVEVLSEVMTTVGPVDYAVADRAALLAALDCVRRVRAWADHAEVLLAERLAVVSPLASSELAQVAHRPPRHGGVVLARAATVAAVPALRAALRSGALDGSHVQAFASALRGVATKDRAALSERADALVAEAVSKAWSPDAWSARLAEEVQRLDGDGGEQREERNDGRLGCGPSPSGRRGCGASPVHSTPRAEHCCTGGSRRRWLRCSPSGFRLLRPRTRANDRTTSGRWPSSR
jgi:hypothetical protein